MPIYRISELQEYLASLERGSKRTLSQNFLIDGNVVQKILSHAQCFPGDIVLEIGPGPGAVTEALLKKEVSVVAVELDRDFSSTLQRFENNDTGRLHVIEGDVLDVSFPELRKRYMAPGKPMKIISNIPYHLTKEILRKIATTCLHPFEATLMVQDEVAQKVVFAKPESSLMTLELALFGSFSYITRVPKGCFFPKPKVDSALISYVSHPPTICSDSLRKQFVSCLSEVYQHRRKSFVGALEVKFGVKREIMEKWLVCHGFLKTARPDDLSLSAWVEFFHAFSQ